MVDDDDTLEIVGRVWCGVEVAGGLLYVDVGGRL